MQLELHIKNKLVVVQKQSPDPAHWKVFKTDPRTPPIENFEPN